MYLTIPDKNIFLGEKVPMDNKANAKFLNKFKSDKNLPFLVCNQFNKSLITGITKSSELSTKNSHRSSIKEKNLKIKKKLGINLNYNLNQEKIDIIHDNKIKAFEALENLLMEDSINDDENNNGSKENNIINNYENNICVIEEPENINEECIYKKGKKNLSVPKLNFSKIFNEYEKRPLYIQEVKYVSKYNIKPDDYIENNNCKNTKKKYHHNQHINSKNKRN